MPTVTDAPLTPAAAPDPDLIEDTSLPTPGRNLMENRVFARVMRSRLYPGILQIPVAAVFGLVAYQLLLGPDTAHDNPGTALMWVLWWPVIPIVFVLLGRFWCAVCPFGLISDTCGPQGYVAVDHLCSVSGHLRSVPDEEGLAGRFDDLRCHRREVVDLADAFNLSEESVDEAEVAAGDAGDRGDGGGLSQVVFVRVLI